MAEITILKNKGIVQGLQSYVDKLKAGGQIKPGTENISKTEWTNTIHTLSEINESRVKSSKKSIFTAGAAEGVTEKGFKGGEKDFWQKNMVVQEGTIELEKAEMDKLLKSMGVAEKQAKPAANTFGTIPKAPDRTSTVAPYIKPVKENAGTSVLSGIFSDKKISAEHKNIITKQVFSETLENCQDLKKVPKLKYSYDACARIEQDVAKKIKENNTRGLEHRLQDLNNDIAKENPKAVIGKADIPKIAQKTVVKRLFADKSLSTQDRNAAVNQAFNETLEKCKGLKNVPKLKYSEKVIKDIETEVENNLKNNNARALDHRFQSLNNDINKK